MRFAWAFAFVLGGCGLTLDLDPPDPKPHFDAGPVDAGPAGCASAPDGRACGEGRICLGERCLRSRCGDGFVDTNAGETCEDGNEISGDGCEPGTCRFTCERDEDCHVPHLRCATARCRAHVCVVDVEQDRADCELDAGTPGICRSGVCVLMTCGNGQLDPGEECDPGITSNADARGCRPDCTVGCKSDEDCDDGIACNGIEFCDEWEVGSEPRAECVSGEAPEAPDCMECDLKTGGFRLIDADGDGYAPYDDSLCPGRGGDCDDRDPTVYPGAPDFGPGDGIDNDCDGEIDEDRATLCWQDADGDGFGVPGPMSFAAHGACPPGTIPATDNASMPMDCDDDDADVFPGQRAFFATSRCEGRDPPLPPDTLCWDYDCDGRETPRWPQAEACAGLFGGPCGAEGWGLLEGVFDVPGCGQSGQWATCIDLWPVCLPRFSGADRTQECR